MRRNALLAASGSLQGLVGVRFLMRLASADEPQSGNYEAGAPYDRSGDAACLDPHRTVEIASEFGQFGAQRLRCHMVAVLRRLTDGIRDGIGLILGKAGAGQLTGDRMSVEHGIRLPRGWAIHK